MNYTVGDLFAGVGGIALGFKNNNFNILWANEVDHNACVTYRANFSHKLIEDSIVNIEPISLEKVDIITAGFPCQAFSIAGNRQGFLDTRGTMFFEIMRFVDAIEPKVLFLENVKNLVGHDGGKTFKVILQELAKRGYMVKYKVLNTHLYSNIPQNRERIYILAFKNKTTYNLFEFPEATNEIKQIQELLEKNVDNYYYYTNNKNYPLLKESITKKNTVYQFRRIYVRENKSNLCPTLTANMGTGGHNVPLILDDIDIRKLTPKECFRFQGFPEGFILPDSLPRSALYKQAGNSVSVPVIERIVTCLKLALEHKQPHNKQQLDLLIDTSA